MPQHMDLTEIGETLVRETLDRYRPQGLSKDTLSVTLLLHSEQADDAPAGYAYRGDAAFYPCSVVKIFYLVAAQLALEEGRLDETAELDRAMHDMIKWSSNTATNYIIDLVTGTTGDIELPPAEMEAWIEARQRINRDLSALGIAELSGINVSQKLMDDDRYGREKAFVRLGGNNHNRLSTNAAAALLSRIMRGQIISPRRSNIMADYLHRDRSEVFIRTPGAQVLNYLAEGMPERAEVWSKAGWTGWTRDPLASYRRHDAIHAKLPSGQCFTLAVFTEGQTISTDLTIFPFMGRRAAALIDGTG